MPRVKTNIKKEKLIKAAIEVFGEKGFKNTTIPKIAKKAGIATGTFYLYFEDKSHIFLESLRQISFQLRNYLDDAFQRAWETLQGRAPVQDDARLATYTVYRAFFDYVDKYRKHFLIIFREGMSYHPEFSNLMWDIFRELAEDTRARLNTGLQLNIIRKLTRVETDAIAWGIVGMLSQVAQLYMEGAYSREELLNALADFTLKGIQKEE